MVSNSLKLAPSILGGDHSMLAEAVRLIKAEGLTWVHVDVMDGHFVPNLSFGPGVVAALKKRYPDMFYDVHLMLDNPNLYIKAFADAGADLISIHVEPEYPGIGKMELHLVGIVVKTGENWQMVKISPQDKDKPDAENPPADNAGTLTPATPETSAMEETPAAENTPTAPDNKIRNKRQRHEKD